VPTPVASVTVTPPSASLTVGSAQQLTATPKDANGGALSGRPVSWTSGNPAVASVDNNGLVSAVAAGSTAITATSEGKSGQAQVTVSVPAGPPATVTDLAVASTNDSAATLSFTEVNDGAG